jgi:hypothetical protein
MPASVDIADAIRERSGTKARECLVCSHFS